MRSPIGQTFEELDEKLTSWVQAQSVFFVATAPLATTGHVNLSPKGMAGTFAVLDPSTVAYLDYFGSGVETIAHLRENGRMVIMFCAFTGPPRIEGIYGNGHTIRASDSAFQSLRPKFTKKRDLGCAPSLSSTSTG